MQYVAALHVVLVIGVGVFYALIGYWLIKSGIDPKAGENAKLALYKLASMAHAIFGALIVLLGIWQFSVILKEHDLFGATNESGEKRVVDVRKGESDAEGVSDARGGVPLEASPASVASVPTVPEPVAEPDPRKTEPTTRSASAWRPAARAEVRKVVPVYQPASPEGVARMPLLQPSAWKPAPR